MKVPCIFDNRYKKLKDIKMRFSVFGRFLGAGLIVALLATSCLTSKDNEYTPERERQLLNDYITNLIQKGYNVDTTAKGVFYVNIDNGSGNFPQAGDTLSVMYAGYLVNGTLFDSSVFHSTDSTYHFIYKVDNMIEGWDDIMAIMNKGRRVEFIVPSSLAYGSKGAGFSIPPYTPLVFVAKMMNIRPKAN